MRRITERTVVAAMSSMRVKAERRGGGVKGFRSEAGRGTNVGGSGLPLRREIYVLSLVDSKSGGQGIGEAGSFGNC